MSYSKIEQIITPEPQNLLLEFKHTRADRAWLPQSASRSNSSTREVAFQEKREVDLSVVFPGMDKARRRQVLPEQI